EAVEKVSGVDSEALALIASLNDQSLLKPLERPAHEPRFAMLETVREFAVERLLAAEEEEAIRGAHAAYFLGLAEGIQGRIHGPEGSRLLDQLEAEHHNLRGALAWLIERGKTELALRLAYACWRLWWMHSHLEQGRVWLERALALADTEGVVSPH